MTARFARRDLDRRFLGSPGAGGAPPRAPLRRRAGAPRARAGAGRRRRFVLRRAMLRAVLGADSAPGSPCASATAPTESPRSRRARRTSASRTPAVQRARGRHRGRPRHRRRRGRAPSPASTRASPALFAPEERQASPLSRPASPRGLLRAWTSKEACSRRSGTGLSLEPNLFAVALDPRAAPGLGRSHTPLLEPARWELTCSARSPSAYRAPSRSNARGLGRPLLPPLRRALARRAVGRTAQLCVPKQSSSP